MKKIILFMLVSFVFLVQTVSADCIDFCNKGDWRCGGSQGRYRIPCGDYDGDGCYEWMPSGWIDCKDAGCSDGYCIGEPKDCTDWCNDGDVRCGGAGGKYKIPCADDNGDGCYEWSVYNHQYCANGCTEESGYGECIGNVPPKSCTSWCDPNLPEKRCGGEGASFSISCVDTNHDGCGEWQPTEYWIHCDFGCYGNGICKDAPTPCEDLCDLGTWRCGGSGGKYRIPCGQSDQDSCYEWDDENWEYCEFGCNDLSKKEGAVCYDDSSQLINLQNESYEIDIYTIGLWHFDECSGSVAYDTATNNLDFLSISAEDWRNESKFNDGCSWSGNSSSAEMYTKATEIPFYKSGFIEMWVYIDPDYDRRINNMAEQGRIFFIGEEWTGNDYIELAYTSADKIECRMDGDDSNRITASTQSLNNYDLYKWNHLSCGWNLNNQLIIYWNGMTQDIATFNDTELASGETTFLEVSLIDNSNDFKFLMDEVRYSSIFRQFSTLCEDFCNKGDARCSGYNASYLTYCADDNGDGCYEWSQFNQTECYYGCDKTVYPAKCRTNPLNMSFCDENSTRCGGSGNNYEIPCADDDGDGFLEWSVNNWVFCDLGCNKDTDKCNQCFDYCNPNDTRCGGNIEGGYLSMQTETQKTFFPLGIFTIPIELEANFNLPNAFTEDNLRQSIITCADDNGDGCYEWSLNNITYCQLGCEDDYNSTTNMTIARCISNATGYEEASNSAIKSSINWLRNLLPNEILKEMFIFFIALIIGSAVTIALKNQNEDRMWEMGFLSYMGFIFVGVMMQFVNPIVFVFIAIISVIALYRLVV